MKKVFLNEEYRAIERLVIHFYLNNKKRNEELFNSFIRPYNWLYDEFSYTKKQYSIYDIHNIKRLSLLIEDAKIVEFNEKFFKFKIRRNSYNIIVRMYHKRTKIILQYKGAKLLIAKCNIVKNKFEWNIENRFGTCSKKAYYMLQEMIYVLTSKFQINNIPNMSFYYYNRRFGSIILNDTNFVNQYYLNRYIKENYHDININELILKVFMSAERMIDKNKNPYYVLNLLENVINNIIKGYWYRFTNIKDLIINKNSSILKEYAPVIFNMYLQIILYNKSNNVCQNSLTYVPMPIIL